MPEDILTLGFGFEADSTVGAIARLAENFDSLEKTTGSVKTALETLFSGSVTAGIAAASTHLMNIGNSMRTASDSALALQVSMTQLPKSFERLSAIKFSPLTQKQVDNIYRFTSSLANMTKQSDFAQYSMGNLAKTMQAMSGFSLDLAKNINRLPGKLERIAQIKMNPISERVIKSLSDYASALQRAAEAMRELVSGQGKISDAPLRKLNKTLEDGKESAIGFWDALIDSGKIASLTKMFKQAIADSTRFGTELAHIGSLTLDFDMGKVRTGLMDLSSEYGDVTKNAEAMYYAYSSGIRGNEKQLVEFTGKMGQLGTLIRADTTTTVDAVTGLMNAYNIPIEESARVADFFYNVIKEGKASGQQLASSLGQVTPTAATAGVKLNELGGAITVLTKVMPTRNAITYLNNALSKLIKPTKESRLEAEKLGIELGLEAVRAKGFANIMAEIKEKTQGSQAAITKLFPDLRGMRGALQLLGAGWGDFQQQMKNFENGAGAADKAMQKLNENAAYQISVLPNTFSKISIEMGNAATQILTLGGALTPLLTKFNQLEASDIRIIAWTATITTGLIGLKIATAGFSLLLGKLLASVSAMGVANTGIIAQLWEEVKARLAVASAANAEASAKAGVNAANVAGAASGVANTVMSATKAGGGFIKGFSTMLNTTSAAKDLKSLGAVIGKLASGAKNAVTSTSGLISAVKSTGSGIAGMLKSLIQFGNSPILGFFTKIFAGFKSVGSIAGVLSKSLTFLGAVIGKVASFFTAASLAIAAKVAIFTAAIAAIGVALDAVFAGGKYTKKFADWVAGVREAEEESKRLDKLRESLEAEKKFRKGFMAGYFEVIQEEFMSGFKQMEISKKPLKEQFKRFYDKFKQDVDLINKNYSKELIESTGKKRNDLYNAYMNLQKISPVERTKMPNYEAKLKEAEEAFNKADAEYRDIRSGAAKQAQNIMATYQSMVGIFNNTKELVQFITKSNEDIRYKMMSPDEQIGFQKNRLKEAQKAYYAGVNSDDIKLAEASYKNMLNAHNALVKFAEDKIKKFSDLGSVAKKDAFDFMLKYTGNYLDRMNIMGKKAKELAGESGVFASDSMEFDAGQLGSVKDLTASYGKAKAAMDMQIRAIQEEINYKKELAQAEAQANQRTLELIRSMDKYRSTAVQAVQAGSADAARLQSRRFANMPNAKDLMSTSSKSGLSQSQAKLDSLYQKMEQMASAFAERAEKEKKDAEANKSLLEKELKDRIDKTETAIRANEERLRKSLEEIPQAVAAALNDPAGMNAILKNIDAHIAGISTVTY